MNPLWTATLNRHRYLVGSVVVLVVFLLADTIVFRSAEARFSRVMKQATDMGLALDPDRAPPVLPPRLFALLSDNSMPTAVAQEQGNSGALTAELLGDLSRMISSHGMEVIASEPGPVTQQPSSVKVRAHLKVRGRYSQFVALMDEIGQRKTLVSLDRFSFVQGADGPVLDLWMSRYVLKQLRAAR